MLLNGHLCSPETHTRLLGGARLLPASFTVPPLVSVLQVKSVSPGVPGEAGCSWQFHFRAHVLMVLKRGHGWGEDVLYLLPQRLHLPGLKGPSASVLCVCVSRTGLAQSSLEPVRLVLCHSPQLRKLISGLDLSPAFLSHVISGALRTFFVIIVLFKVT